MAATIRLDCVDNHRLPLGGFLSRRSQPPLIVGIGHQRLCAVVSRVLSVQRLYSRILSQLALERPRTTVRGVTAYNRPLVKGGYPQSSNFSTFPFVGVASRSSPRRGDLRRSPSTRGFGHPPPEGVSGDPPPPGGLVIPHQRGSPAIPLHQGVW